jgi:hypothetical protein
MIIRIFSCRRALFWTSEGDYMNEYGRGLFHLAKAVSILLLLGGSTLFAQTPQERVHQMAHSVMPFDMSKTVHIFKMTESGGVQRVIAKDADDTDQIALIQHHLKHEAEKFQHGDYSDPARLHGGDMPGLKDLQAGASGIKVSYAALSVGAEITFETTDLHLLTAIHRWFGAQLSEYGADAKAE